jgi:hypothetical protein
MNSAMKKWSSDDAHDWEAKKRVQDILRARWNYRCVFDRTIFIDKKTFEIHLYQPDGCTSKEDVRRKYEIFIPDIFIKTKQGYKIVELDGDFHFNTKKGVKRTNQRNEMYEYAGIKMIWFYTPKLMKMTIDEIVHTIEDSCWI